MTKNMLKKSVACVLLVLLAVVVGHAEIVEQIIVKVNGEILTKTELEQRQVAAIRARNRGAQIDLENDAELKKAIEEVTPELIVDAIDEMLILQQGRDRGYRLGDDQFNSIVERIRKENKLEDQEKFEAALKQEGLTMADLRRSLERQMVVSNVQRDMVGRISVTDQEAREYYEAHPEQFTTPSSVTLREILVAVPEKGEGEQAAFNAAADEEARAEAERLRQRALSGEDVGVLAASESDAPSKANGGLVGPLSHDELSEAMQKLIEPLQAGGVSTVVRTPRGYQFFEVETLTPAAVKPFEQAREEIVNRVYAERRNAEFRKQIQKLRQQAIIEWKNDRIKELYERQVAADAQQPRA